MGRLIQMAKGKGQKKSKKQTSKPTRKNFRLILAVIIIICIIGAIWLVLSPDTVEAKAQLIIDSGTVEVKHAGGSWSSAQTGMDLYQSDSVRTGDDSSASIILFKSSVVRLDSNTEITLREIIEQEEEKSVAIDQGAGRTWNTVSKISGIDNYEVHTPTTVASVYGTGFVVVVETNGTTYYGVAHGTLNVSSISNDTIQDEIDVSGNEAVIVYVDLVNETLEVIDFEMDDWVVENLLKDDQFKDDLKAEIYKNIEQYIPELKQEFGTTDEELEILIDGYVNGDFELPPDTPEWARELIELS
jgi:hypothetical protein